MITYANSQDKEAVYQLWKTLFSHDDGGYTDFYFRFRYEDAITYVYKVAGEVVATLQRRSHQLVFDNQIISASMILGVATKPSHQGKGYMHALMEKALQDARQVEQVTMIQAYYPEMYLPFGFVPYYYRKQIAYKPLHQLPQGFLGDVDIKQCVMLYQTMMKQYTGYVVRDVAYYKYYQMELAAQGYLFIGYYDTGLMQAYAVLELGDKPLVSECVGSPAACDALLALIYQEYGAFDISISNADKQDKIDTMLLFHDWETTQLLLHSDATSPQAYMYSLKKPLYLHECA